MRRKHVCRWLGYVVLLTSAVAMDARAQTLDYPTQRITIVAGFAAGGSVDAIARVIAEKLQERWARPVVVENRTGATGNLAAAAVARANPDGHTLLFTATGVAINQSLYESPGFSIKDLTPISFSAVNTVVFAVNPKHPARTLQEFVQQFVHSGKSFVFGTAGTGSGAHITAEYFFKVLAKVDAVHTPYQSGAQAATALLGGHIDLISVAQPDAAAHVRQGTLRALAVSGARRSEALPDTPTFDEAGFPGFSASGWIAMFVPARTSREIALKLNAAVNDILQTPDVRQRLDAVGFSPNTQSLDGAAAFLRLELDNWGRMVKAIGLTIR
jgi:tripartite-type tricarboxylate transporter receptor subunit TctC